jgi:sugar O-acyltransferase (sialic acid O-acetyltransferase NeuD family)
MRYDILPHLTKYPVIILGAGGHAKVLIDTLRACSVEIIGVVDTNPDKFGKSILDVPVIGNDDIVIKYKRDAVRLVNGIGSVGLPTRRKEIFDKFKNVGFTFLQVVHPSAVISPDVKLLEGSQIMAGVVIQPGSQIGKNTIVNTRVSIDHDCLIGDHVHLAPGVTLSGTILIGQGVHIGTGASVINGISIGNYSLIAAGAVVIDNISDNTVVKGVPAK